MYHVDVHLSQLYKEINFLTYINMEVKIWENTLVLEDKIKMKQIRVLYPLFKDLESWKIDEISILDKVIEVLFISLDWDTSKEKLKEFMDNLELEWIEQLTEIIWKTMDNLNGKKK
jgi:hypothetical protein